MWLTLTHCPLHKNTKPQLVSSAVIFKSVVRVAAECSLTLITCPHTNWAKEPALWIITIITTTACKHSKASFRPSVFVTILFRKWKSWPTTWPSSLNSSLVIVKSWLLLSQQHNSQKMIHKTLYTISQGQAMKLSAKFRPRLLDLPRIHVKGLFTYTKLIQLNNNNNLKKRCWV